MKTYEMEQGSLKDNARHISTKAGLFRKDPAVAFILCLAFAFAGCGNIRPGTEAVLSPAKPSSHYRVFDDFAAVVAQPDDTFASLAEKFLDDASKGWVIQEFNGIDKIVSGQKLVVPFDSLGPVRVRNGKYQTVPVLTYHKFSRDVRDAMTVRARDFEAQMNYLEQNGYKVVGLERLYRYMLATERLPEKSVVITIDDGWRSFYQLGYPILKKHGFPATLFVYTELISGSSITLDWNLIEEMARNGIDIQAHSKTHRNFNERFPGESADQYFRSLKTEIVGSAEIIDRRVGKKVRFFAYPYGEQNSLAAALLEKNGFQAAFTVERKSAPFFSDRYRIGRRMVYGDFDLDAFKRNLQVYDDEALR